MTTRCERCGGAFHLPGLFSCDDTHHPTPTLGQRVALLIERDLYGRGELRRAWADLAPDAKDETRAEWARLVRLAEVEHNIETYFATTPATPKHDIPPEWGVSDVDSRLRALGYELAEDGVTWRYVRG